MQGNVHSSLGFLFFLFFVRGRERERERCKVKGENERKKDEEGEKPTWYVGSLSCQRVRLNLRAMLFICIHVSSSIPFSFHPIIISITTTTIVALQLVWC